MTTALSRQITEHPHPRERRAFQQGRRDDNSIVGGKRRVDGHVTNTQVDLIGSVLLDQPLHRRRGALTRYGIAAHVQNEFDTIARHLLFVKLGELSSP